MHLTLMEFLTNYFTPVGNNKFPLTTYTDIEKLMKLNFPKSNNLHIQKQR